MSVYQWIVISNLILVSCKPKPAPESSVSIAGGKEITRESILDQTKPADIRNVEQQILASMVGILSGSGDHFCSGVLIGPNQVLTAGHCLWYQGLPRGSLKVGFGEKLEHQRRVTQKLLHEKAVKEQNIVKLTYPTNDIAVLMFEGNLPEGVKPVAVTTKADDLKERGLKFWIAGYGPSGSVGGIFGWIDNDDNGILRYGETIFKKETPESLRFETISDDLGVCKGDSGGPTYIEKNNKLFVAGITLGFRGLAFGCDTAVWTITTDVRSYTEWIENNAGINLINGAPKPQTISAEKIN